MHHAGLLAIPFTIPIAIVSYMYPLVPHGCQNHHFLKNFALSNGFWRLSSRVNRQIGESGRSVACSKWPFGENNAELCYTNFALLTTHNSNVADIA